MKIVEKEWAQIMAIELFVENVNFGAYNDYDGSGHPAWRLPSSEIYVEDDAIIIVPSSWHDHFPKTATHIAWYNK